MYRLSAKQIIIIALISGMFAATAVAVLDRVASRLQPSGVAALSEKAPAGVTDPSTATDEQNNIEIYRAVSAGVVNINATSYGRNFFGFVEPQEGTGSGSVIDEQGDILTNYHVVQGSQKLTVTFGGEKAYAAKLIGEDPDTDLAVVRLIERPKEPLTIVSFGDSDKLEVGQKVLAIGNPFGLDRTLTKGVISALQRPIRAPNNRLIKGAIQTDAAINPGNSGGPLLDSHGRMIGINSQILSPAGASNGLGFAIPASIAKRIVPQLVSFGSVRRPKLGISPRDIAAIKGQVELPVSDGVMILQITSGGAAASADLHGLSQTENGDVDLGDIIVGIDGEKVGNTDDLSRLLDKHQVGDTIKVEIVRNGKHMTVPVRLTEAPDTRRGVQRR
jgi:S1-C subfamily serine protease